MSQPGPRIELASTCDLDRVLEIEALCFNDPWPRRSFEDELDNESARLLLLWLPGSDLAAAFIDYWRVLDEVHLMDIAVDPAFQRQGLAQRLIDHMLADPYGQGEVARALLEVRVTNAPAITLYRRLGFAEEGRRKRYYPDGEDALVMTLQVPFPGNCAS